MDWWASAMILWVQMEMIMLIQHAEKKRNLIFLRDMKWVNGVLAMVMWWLIEILFTTTLHFINIEIPDYAQINDELYTFSQTILAKETIYNLTLEIYGSFPIYVLLLLITILLLQIICQILDYWEIVTEHIFSKNISTLYTIWLMY